MNAKVLIFFAVAKCVLGICNVPPSHWCDSREVAVNCGVEHACKDHLLSNENAKPVNISLFYESLCPFCRQFITDQLFPTWKTLMSSGIMVNYMVPYGNAHEAEISTGYYNYTCQHGPDECTGNLIENCVLKYAKYDFNVYFPIVYCIEKAKDPIAAAEKCVTEGHQDWKTIDTCAKGKEGNALMHEAALRTGELEPKHKYVPWILVNGMHTEAMQQEAQSNLLKVVCDTYTGVKPNECKRWKTEVCMQEK